MDAATHLAHLHEAAEAIRSRAAAAPEVGIVLGTGLGALAAEIDVEQEIPYDEIPHFVPSTVESHSGRLLIGSLEGRRVIAMQGRLHLYEGYRAWQIVFPVRVMSLLGAQTLVVSNASGGMNPLWTPGELMLIADHINYAGMNPLIGEPTDRRFVNMVDAYDPELRRRSRAIADDLGVALKEGVYLWYSGPSFETVAEIRMAIALGANAVGMSTAPEVILARMLGLRVWACSSITNMGAGLSDETISHAHTKAMAVQGAEKLKRLIPALVEAL